MPLPFNRPADQAVDSIVNLGAGIKSQCGNYITRLQAGAVNANEIVSVLSSMNSQLNQISNLLAIPGIDAAAVASPTGISGYSGSISADLQATANAMQLVINWVVANVPKDPGTNTYSLIITMNPNGTTTWRSFTPAQTAGLVTALQGVIASIA